MTSEALPADLLERVVQAENVAWYEWTAGVEKIRVSQGYAALLDLDPDNVTTRTALDEVHPDDRAAFRAAQVAFFKSRDTHLTIEYRFRQRGGAVRWARLRAMADRDAAGRVTRMTGTLSEITERKLQEAQNRALLARQAASVEVLKAITASPDDPQPVFELIIRRACELCNAQAGSLFEYDGTLMHIGHRSGYAPEADAQLRAVYPRPPGMDTFPGRVVLSGQRVHMPDAQADPSLIQQGRAQGARAYLGVPLLREGRVIGALTLARFDPGEYDESAIELVQSFAEQAVIAITGAKTLKDLHERDTENRALIARQQASIEVLKAISESPDDTQPVFELIARHARTLCGATSVSMTEFDGTLMHARVSDWADPEAREAWFATYPRPPGPETGHGRATLSGKTGHVRDVSADPLIYQAGRRVSTGSSMHVPLLRDGRAIGAIVLLRDVAGGFTDSEAALVESFAEQASLAISGATTLRNLRTRTTELRETLDQQTATAEVLGVINASPGNLTPVFDAMLERALRLCGAYGGGLMIRDGEDLRYQAMLGMPAAFTALRLGQAMPVTPESPPGRMLRTGRTVPVEDTLTDPYFVSRPELRDETTGMGGARSVLNVPLLKDGAVRGAFVIFRESPGTWPDQQVALLESFAAQAVIAMENARLLEELRERTEALAQRNDEYGERIEHQRATIDVLKAMSESRDDPRPVFELIARRAGELMDARGALWEYDGALIHRHAGFNSEGYNAQAAAAFWALFPMPADRRTIVGRTIVERAVVEVEDALTDPEIMPELVANGARSYVGIPIFRGDRVVGAITMNSPIPGRLSESQIGLLHTFAEQAAIAIGSAEAHRALQARTADLQEALERQTATAEVLGVINQHPGDLTPVFDAILEKALRICQPAFGSLTVFEASRIYVLAARGETEALAEYRARNPGNSFSPNVVRLIETKRPIHVLDLRESEGYRSGHPAPMAVADLGGARSFLLVPLLKDQTVIGAIQIYRQEVRAFSDKESALVENFAAQAVIAMENARLLTEIRAARDHAEESLRELKIAQANLVQAEKMASLGQLTAGIAHEIKNPLNFVNNFAALSVDLLDEFKETAAPALSLLTDDQRADIDDVSEMLTTNLRKIEEHGKRADGIVRAMLEHSRGASGERRAVDINGLVEEALNLAYHGARARDQSFNVTLERDYADDIAPIEVNPQDLTRVFLNIIGNGFYATTKRAETDPGYAPTLRVTTRAAGDSVEIAIRDNGTGIPPGIRDKLFQPFFTTKPTGEGTGLGLSITYDIVTKQHGGAITVDSEPGAFTEFSVTLPRHMFDQPEAKS